MQEKSYFYLSGFLSVSLYLAIIITFLMYINAPKPKKFDSAKTTVLELELISTKKYRLFKALFLSTKKSQLMHRISTCGMVCSTLSCNSRQVHLLHVVVCGNG